MKCLVFLFFLYISFLCYGYETERMPNRCLNIDFGVCASAHINITGDWHNTDSHKIPLSFGCGVGGGIAFIWTNNWMSTLEIIVGYDKLLVDYENVANRTYSLSSASISIPLSVGYKFGVSDLISLAPLAGCNTNYNYYRDIGSQNEHFFKLQPWNFSVGLGCAIIQKKIIVDVMGYFGMINMKNNQIRSNPYSRCYDNKICITTKYYF